MRYALISCCLRAGTDCYLVGNAAVPRGCAFNWPMVIVASLTWPFWHSLGRRVCYRGGSTCCELFLHEYGSDVIVIGSYVQARAGHEDFLWYGWLAFECGLSRNAGYVLG